MPSLISLLWIGPGHGLAENGVPGAATLDVVWVRNCDEAIKMVLAEFDVIVIAHSDRGQQQDTIRQLARQDDSPPLLVIARAADTSAMREVMPVGAGDVISLCDSSNPLPRPAQAEESTIGYVGDVDDEARRRVADRWGRDLVRHVRRLRDARRARRGQAQPDHGSSSHPDIIASSAAFRSVLDMIDRAATGETSVLLEGETGTGKEVLARTLHRTSARAQAPFVAINCAALTDSLLESELFGHLRGAFTGATSNKSGLFEAAAGGTLFLDEIGETSPSLQAKLLRALQDKEIRPVGGTASRKVDARIVSATNRNLRQQASQGEFREDLYYRLAVFPITIPPLRKRREDILPLAQHFLAIHNKNAKLRPCSLSQASADLMQSHSWPGNVRELENEIQRMIALSEPGDVLTPEHLSSTILSPTRAASAEVRAGETLRETVARAETALIRSTLTMNGGRRAKSARQLGITREGLYKKMKRLKIE